MYNHKRRNARDDKTEMEYWEKYKIQKLKVKNMVRELVTLYEANLTRNIKDIRENGKKMWQMIDKLRGGKRKEERLRIYDRSGDQIPDENVRDVSFNFWSRMYQKRDNDMMRVWNVFFFYRDSESRGP